MAILNYKFGRLDDVDHTSLKDELTNSVEDIDVWWILFETTYLIELAEYEREVAVACHR